MTTQILDNIATLHMALYDRMASIPAIPGLQFLGFDDSTTRPELPKVAMHMTFRGFEIDRGRTIPSVYEETAQETYLYDGEEFTVPSEYAVKRPLPVDLLYDIHSWCHDSQLALSMDMALLATFPERGILTFVIDAGPAEFPIELLGIQDLDDLAENIRERAYRYKVEAWVPSHILDASRKIITTPITEFHAGDAGSPLMEEMVLAPDV